SITNINRSILSQQTLTNLGNAISNFQSVAEGAVKVVKEAQELLQTNGPAVNAIATNLNVFSQKLNTVADQVSEIISTNRADINEAVKNLRDTSASFKQLSADLQAGKGVAGMLLKDSQTKT